MRTVVFCVASNSSGGAERVIINLANYFADKSYKTILVNSDKESNFYPVNSKVKVIKLGVDDSIKVYRISNLIVSLIKLFIKEKPDAVVVFLFNMEVPVIISGLVTNTNVYSSVRNSARSYSGFVRLFRKIFYPHIKGIVFQSNLVMKHTDFKNVKNKRIIMNPVSDVFIKNNQFIPCDKRRKHIITVGRLTEQKNHRLLIKAFNNILSKYPEYELHIYGRGELENELKHLISSLKLNNKVFLKGEVSNAISLHRDAYCFVLSSDYEGFPNALAEAMVSGIPSISTKFDSGIATELITDGVNGFTCETNDLDGLSKKMEIMLGLSENDYNDLVKNSMAISSLMSIDTIGKKWEDFLFKGE